MYSTQDIRTSVLMGCKTMQAVKWYSGSFLKHNHIAHLACKDTLSTEHPLWKNLHTHCSLWHEVDTLFGLKACTCSASIIIIIIHLIYIHSTLSTSWVCTVHVHMHIIICIVVKHDPCTETPWYSDQTFISYGVWCRGVSVQQRDCTTCIRYWVRSVYINTAPVHTTPLISSFPLSTEQ